MGSTSVHVGRFTVNAPGVHGGHTELDTHSEFGGTGQLGRLTVYNGGRVRPGNGSGGTLTAGQTQFNPGSRLVIDLGNAYLGKLAVAGTVTINPAAVLDLRAEPTFSIANTLFTTFIDNDGADAIVGTFQGLPEGRSVPAGPRNLTISYVGFPGSDGNNATLTVRDTLDIDGDSRYLADTDGLLIARHINNLSGAALGTSAVAPASVAKRTDNTNMKAYLAHLGTALDVDQSGGVPNTTDTVLILRYLFGFRDAALVAGLTIPGTQTAATITQRLMALTP